MDVNLLSPKLYPYLLHERNATYSTPMRRIKTKKPITTTTTNSGCRRHPNVESFFSK